MLNEMASGTVRLRIPEILKERGMTTSEFAQKTGLSFNTASALARGLYDRIGMETIARVCDALGIQPGEIFDYSQESTENR